MVTWPVEKGERGVEKRVRKVEEERGVEKM